LGLKEFDFIVSQYWIQIGLRSWLFSPVRVRCYLYECIRIDKELL